MCGRHGGVVFALGWFLAPLVFLLIAPGVVFGVAPFLHGLVFKITGILPFVLVLLAVSIFLLRLIKDGKRGLLVK